MIPAGAAPAGATRRAFADAAALPVEPVAAAADADVEFALARAAVARAAGAHGQRAWTARARPRRRSRRCRARRRAAAAGRARRFPAGARALRRRRTPSQRTRLVIALVSRRDNALAKRSRSSAGERGHVIATAEAGSVGADDDARGSARTSAPPHATPEKAISPCSPMQRCTDCPFSVCATHGDARTKRRARQARRRIARRVVAACCTAACLSACVRSPRASRARG